MTDTPNRPPLWEVMADAFDKAAPAACSYGTEMLARCKAAEIRALRDWIEKRQVEDYAATLPDVREVIGWLTTEADRAERGEVEMTPETATITVPRIRDNDGQPTCRWWKHHCPFLMQSGFGTREHCFWLEGSGKHRPQLERREDGIGTTIPHQQCPVWGEVE